MVYFFCISYVYLNKSNSIAFNFDFPTNEILVIDPFSMNKFEKIKLLQM